ncbi:FHA domain-containing protein [Neorhodopirellula lusitana]|uniref:FHA domain-containing protein n=1 Tax=Neorhodopirellula lusitana TaxID=445327 RepID=UPI00384B9F3F
MTPRPTTNREQFSRQWIIGCDEDVDILIKDPVVSRRHCRLSLYQGRYFIEDLASRNGTFLSTDRVVTRLEIEPAAKVMLAGRVPMPWPDESMAQECLHIGRAQSNDIVLDDESVSSVHAMLFRDPHDLWLIRDLESTNGIRLNESRLTDIAHLAPSDVIVIGSVETTLSRLRRDASERSAKANSNASGIPAAGVGRSGSTTKKNVRSGFNDPGSDAELGQWFQDGWRKLTPVSRLAMLVCMTLIGGGVAWKLAMSSASTSGPVAEIGAADAETLAASSTSLTDQESDESAEPGSLAMEGVDQIHASLPSEQKEVEPPKDFLAAVRQSLYWLTCESAGNRFKIGTALAIDDSRLITSAKIVEQVRELGTSLVMECCHVESGKTFVIEASLLHPQWTENREAERRGIEALREVQAAVPDPSSADDEWRQRRDQIYRSVLAAQMLARVHGIALVKTNEPLAVSLSSELGDWKLEDSLLVTGRRMRPMSKQQLVGAFFDADDSYVDPEAVGVRTEGEAVPLFLLPRITSSMPRMYVGKISLDGLGSPEPAGSPIVSPNGQWVGMISSPTRLGPDQKQRYQSFLTDGDQVFDWISPEVILETLRQDDEYWKPLTSSASESLTGS